MSCKLPYMSSVAKLAQRLFMRVENWPKHFKSVANWPDNHVCMVENLPDNHVCMVENWLTRSKRVANWQ